MATEQDPIGITEAEVKALSSQSTQFMVDTVEAYEALSRRMQIVESLQYHLVKRLEGLESGASPTPSKPMRIRVNASRTSKGYSVEATLEGTELVEQDWAERLEAQALTRLGSVMAMLNDQYPRS